MLVFPYRDQHIAINPAAVAYVEPGSDGHAIVNFIADPDHALHLQASFMDVVRGIEAHARRGG